MLGRGGLYVPTKKVYLREVNRKFAAPFSKRSNGLHLVDIGTGSSGFRG